MLCSGSTTNPVLRELAGFRTWIEVGYIEPSLQLDVGVKGGGIKVNSEGLTLVTKGLVVPLPERQKLESLREDGEFNTGHICLEVS